MFSKTQKFNLMQMIDDRKETIKNCKMEIAVLMLVLDTKNEETMSFKVPDELKEIFSVILMKYGIQKNEKGLNINLLEALKKELYRLKKHHARETKFYIYCLNGNRQESQKYHNLLREEEMEQIEHVSGLDETLQIVEMDGTKRTDYGNKEEGYRHLCELVMKSYKEREDIIKYM